MRTFNAEKREAIVCKVHEKSSIEEFYFKINFECHQIWIFFVCCNIIKWKINIKYLELIFKRSKYKNNQFE